MQTKKIFLLVVAATSFIWQENHINAVANPVNTGGTLADTPLLKYLEKPRFTKTGLADFFRLQFNSDLYAQFLPRSFVHLIDFIDYANETKKPTSFVIKVFNIFDQRIKECSWINPYALIALMNEFLTRLPIHCAVEDHGNRTTQIKNALKKLYEKNKKTYKNNPDLFFEQASRSIDANLGTSRDDLDALETQLCATKFLEYAIGRLIWNPHDQLEIWHTIRTIAEKLCELHKAGIIASADELNILLWTLIYRFGYFIDCAGSQLDPDFFTRMASEISQIHAFCIDEQDYLLLKKVQYLDNLATRGKAKATAAKTGLYVDGIL